MSFVQGRIIKSKLDHKQSFMRAIRLARDRNHISKAAYYELRNSLEES